MSGNYDDLLGGRVTPSASFKGQFPIEWEGVVDDVTRNPAYEYDPSKPSNRGAQKFWPDGNPVMNVWVTLITDIRDPNIQGDDGRRVLVLDSKNKLEAVQQAVRETGTSFEKGGRLRIQWYGNDPAGKNPDNPPKLYRAQWTPPTFDNALGGGWGQQQPGPTGPAAPAPQATGGWGQQAAQQPSGAPATGGWGNNPPAANGYGPVTPQAAAPAAQGWGAQPAAQATTPAAQPNAAAAGWGAPAAAAPAPAASEVHPGLAAALAKAGYPVQPGVSQQQAEQMAAMLGLKPGQ